MVTHPGQLATGALADHPLARQLASLSQQRFSGRLELNAPSSIRPWSIYFCLGRIFYATGGAHALRRFRRQLAQHCPGVDLAALAPKIPALGTGECLEYRLLTVLLEAGHISREQAVAMTRAIVDEVMLDVALTERVHWTLHRDQRGLAAQLTVLSTEQVLGNLQQAWQTWQVSGLARHSLNDVPVVRLPESLRERVSPTVFRAITGWLDGKRSLRDLAVQMKQNVFSLTRSLSPYISTGIIELVQVLDVPPLPAAPPPQATVAAPGGPLIACIDDSPQICQLMEAILTGAGYRFLGLQDPLRAIVSLLQHKPEMIFLDLVMPHTNGYEICSRLRRTASFQNVPIVILTGNDGIIDRVRAKVVGSSDFLSKPVDAETVLAIAQKYLAVRPAVSPQVKTS